MKRLTLLSSRVSINKPSHGLAQSKAFPVCVSKASYETFLSHFLRACSFRSQNLYWRKILFHRFFLPPPSLHRSQEQHDGGLGVEGTFSFMCGRRESGKHARPESKSIKASSFGFWVSIGFGSSKCYVLRNKWENIERKKKQKVSEVKI